MEHEHCDVDGSTLWSCGTCDKETMTMKELIAHYRDKHEGDLDSEIDFTERGEDEKDNA